MLEDSRTYAGPIRRGGKRRRCAWAVVAAGVVATSGIAAAALGAEPTPPHGAPWPHRDRSGPFDPRWSGTPPGYHIRGRGDELPGSREHTQRLRFQVCIADAPLDGEQTQAMKASGYQDEREEKPTKNEERWENAPVLIHR